MGTSHSRKTSLSFDNPVAQTRTANHWRFIASVAIAMALLLCTQGIASAAKVTVSPHGQQDFLTIQEGIDYAAPGDTIVIGLGVHQTGYATRFEQGTYRTALGWIDKPLTFIRDGTNGIIRGPSDADHWAFFSLGAFDVQYIGLQIENVYGGMSAGVGGNVLVEGCKFNAVTVGTAIGGQTGWMTVVQSEFEETRRQCILASVGARAVASACAFGLQSDRSGGLAVAAVNGAHAEIANCTMAYGSFVEVNSGGSALLRDSSADNVASSILECFGSTSSLRAYNVTARAVPIGNGTPIAIRVRQGLVEAEDVTLTDFWRIAQCQSSGSLVVKNSQFLEWTDEYAVHVRAYFDPSAVLNMKNNYWGTTDLDSIASVIYDGNDNPEENPFGFVGFTPIAHHPLPTASESFGSIKSRY